MQVLERVQKLPSILKTRTIMSQLQKNEEEEIEGSTPSPSGPHDDSRQEDDSLKPSKVLKKEAINESESENMTGKRGYNETPPTVPVKSTKQ